jgi:iron complex outermembrane receptor protein
MKADEYGVTLLFSHRFNDAVAFSSTSRYVDQKVDYAEVYGFPPWTDAARTLLGREFYVLDGYYYTYNSDNNAQIDFKTGRLEHKVLLGADYTLFKHGRDEGFSCRGTIAGTCWDGGSPPPLDVYNPVYGQPFTFGFTNSFKTESTQVGVYLQDQMRWNDRVSFVLGARRDRSTNERINTPPKFENYATTFKAGVIAEVVEGVSPYVSYSESFTPLFGTDFFGNHFKPQEAEQYEGGIKWQPNSRSLVTVAYFDIEESGFLSRDPTNIQNRLQGGAIGVKGFEVEAALSFPNGFALTANYSDVDAEILVGTVAQPAGTRVPNLPETIASLWLNKSFIVSDDLTWRVAAGGRRNGDEVDAGQLTTTPAVTLIDAMVEVGFRDWDISVNVNNVTDKEYYSSCGVTTCAPGVTRAIVGTVLKKF